MGILQKRTLYLALVAGYLVARLTGSPDATPCPAQTLAAVHDPLKSPECFYKPPVFFSNGSNLETATTAAYLDARERFVSEAQGFSRGQLIRKVITQNDDAIDILIIPCAQTVCESALVHISGTHGVEGFVGSGVQTAALRSIRNNLTTIDPSTTVVFVHGLNAFGFKNGRRVNENNVDLNRNAVFDPALWSELLGRDPNVARYESLQDMINPKDAPGLYSDISVAARLVQFAWENRGDTVPIIKRALVSGTYTNPRGVYYGGRALEASIAALKEVLTKNLDLNAVKRVAVVDIHSGLGPFGRDTLMTSGSSDQVKRFSSIFNTGDSLPFAIEAQTMETDVPLKGAASGYDLVLGDVQANLWKLFPNVKRGNEIAITQEFGTYAQAWIGWISVRENQAYQYYLQNPDAGKSAWVRLSADMVRAFSPTGDEMARAVVTRGIDVLRKGLKAIA